MSCYHPLVASPGVRDDGKIKMSIVKPGDKFTINDLTLYYPDAILIPCGKCLGCRLDYSRRWADRMILEYMTCKKAIFLTLTYDDEHIPILFHNDCAVGYSLKKKDLQDFLKRLRRAFDGLDGHPGPIKIRFYAAGEYGSHTFRPHYHLIVFGLDLDDFPDLEFLKQNGLGQILYKSDFLASLWPFGIHSLATATYETMAYTARYVAKKVSSTFDPDSIGVEPEFCNMSRRPGLGSQYLIDHPDLFDYDSIAGPDGRKIMIPRYFIDRLPDLDKEQFMDKRKALSVDKELYRLQISPLFFMEQNAIDERQKISKTSVDLIVALCALGDGFFSPL